MKFVIISDTHGLHHDLTLPEGDVLVHCGDFCDITHEDGVYGFLEWFGKRDFTHKILVAGNHDFFAWQYPDDFKDLLPEGVIYLNDSGTTISDFRIWGSPVQPNLEGWAFGKPRGRAIKMHWDLIPPDTDILVTHTPPYGILDRSSNRKQLGCTELVKEIYSLNLKAHFFGHIHAGYGKKKREGTTFVNASNIKTNVGIVNEAVVVEL